MSLDVPEKHKLELFYRELFPMEQLYAWTQYGSQSNPKLTAKREYSLTISSHDNPDGVFSRYNCCPTLQTFRSMFTLSSTGQYVSKLDIGPIYNGDVSRHREQTLTPQEKELVFDIDMDDYNSVRKCCTDKKVCKLCFRFLIAAATVLRFLLETTFGFKHVLFVFSGRRGIHCWVNDFKARILSSDQRELLAKYMNSGLQENKRLPQQMLNHPMLVDSAALLEDEFIQVMKTQNIFPSTATINNLLLQYSDQPQFAWMKDLEKQSKTDPTDGYKWPAINGAAEYTQLDFWMHLKKKQPATARRILLDYLYPRLDVEVSKQFNHLLKSPFVIHPKTGKVCVPIPYDDLATFDLDTVPSLDTLLAEYKQYASGGQKGTLTFNDSMGVVKTMQAPRTAVLHTSLRPYVEYFTSYVRTLIEAEMALGEAYRNQGSIADW